MYDRDSIPQTQNDGDSGPQTQDICMNDINCITYNGDIEILSGVPGPSKGNCKTAWTNMVDFASNVMCVDIIIYLSGVQKVLKSLNHVTGKHFDTHTSVLFYPNEG